MKSMSSTLYSIIYWLDRISLMITVVAIAYFALQGDMFWTLGLIVAALVQVLMITCDVGAKVGLFIGLKLRQREQKEWEL